MAVKLTTKKAITYSFPVIIGAICLFIYLFYRPNSILINSYSLHLFPNYTELKTNINILAPLNEFFIYNLPSGLWVMALTICSGNYDILLFSKKIKLAHLPIALGLTIELFQLLGLTNGTFDIIDILTMVVFAFLSFQLDKRHSIFIKPSKTQPILIFIGFTILFFGNN